MNLFRPTTKLKMQVKLAKLRYRHASKELFVRRCLVKVGRLPIKSRRATATAFTALLVIGTTMVMLLSSPVTAGAQTLSFSNSDLLSGSTQWSQIDRSNNQLQLQNGVAGTWNNTTGLAGMPSMVNGTTALAYGPNDTIYMMTAFDSQCHYEKYDVERQIWSNLNTPPVGCGTGNLLMYDKVGSMYYMPGSSTGRIFRYDITDDSWHELTGMPTNIDDLAYGQYATSGANKYIFVTRGLSSPSLWRYTIGTDTWANMTPFPTTSNVANGIAMAYDGADSIFAFSNDVGDLRKYTISTNSWTSLGNTSNGCQRNSMQYVGGTLLVSRLYWCAENTSLRSYNIAAGTWTTLATPPSTADIYDYQPPSAYDGSRYLYVMYTAEIRPSLYRYDTQTSSWSETGLFNPASDNAEYHFKVMPDGAGGAYFLGGVYGGNVDRVYRYDLTTKTTTQVGSQIATNSGYSGTYSGGSLYLLPNGGTTFQKYNTSTNQFTMLSALPRGDSAGADIVDGGDGYLYAVLGQTNTFYRYSMANDIWTQLSSAPQSEGTGGAIRRIGTKIYVLVGGQSAYLLQYDMTATTWSTLANTPVGSLDWGAFMASDTSRYLYIGMSSRTDATAKKVYRYDTTNATYQRIADIPAVTSPYANAFWDTNAGKLYVAQGEASAHIWDYSPGTTAYVTSGTWFSKTYDMKQVQSWTSLTDTVGGTGTTTVYTRTSSDSKIWTAWSATSGTNITSPVNRYLQMKVVLSGSGTATPVVSNIAIAYTQESTAPNLPAQFNAFSTKGGTALTTGQTYESTHPYFSWTASDDGTNGSGVAGYYIYYGTDSSGDPATDGEFQTGTDFTVTTPMTAGNIYYLRIKVKDNLGNISSAATFFSYRYYYVSPPGAIVETSTADFTGGVNTNVNSSGDQMSLVQSSTGAWATGPQKMPTDNMTGPAGVIVGNFMYVARGSTTNVFYRYDLTTEAWTNMAAIPGNVGTGSSIAWDQGNYLYLIAGQNTSNFYRYDIQNNSWLTLPVLSNNAQNGTVITWIGNGQFAIMFTGIREFDIYKTSDNSFTPKTVYPDTITNAGDGMWWDGNDNIYAYLGSYNWNNERSRPAMVKYTISQDTWRILANPPVIQSFVDNNLQYDGNGGLYIFGNNVTDDLGKNQRAMRFDIASNTWKQVNGWPSQTTWGSSVSDNTRYIYSFPSENTNVREMLRLDTQTGLVTPNTGSVDPLDRVPWDAPQNAWQWNETNSSTMAYDGARWLWDIGVGGEGNFSTFMKYDPSTGDTKYYPAPPYVGVSGTLSYLNGYLYYLPARSLSELYRFDEVNQQWTKMANMPSTAYRPGTSSGIVVGSSIYYSAGTVSKNVYKYTPDAGLGTWTTLAAAPGNAQNGAFVYDAANNYIYEFAANGGGALYRYSISGNTWTSLATAPAGSSYGSTLAMNNGNLYMQLGNYVKASYIYNIAANTWTQGVDSPEQFRWGSQAINMGTYSLNMAGENTPNFWKFNFPSATTAYNGLGTHISQAFPIAGIYDYANITATANVPANTTVDLYTRTSADGITWNNWSAADQVKTYGLNVNGRVTSPVKKFIQIKIVMQSMDNLYTPTVYDYSLNYYFDVDPPVNPTVLHTFQDNTDTTELTSATWYNYATPDFVWPDPGQPGAANDGPLGSHIAGYWVYVGTDPSASPQTAGVFVTTQHYVPNLTASGIYYVRIQTQDNAGNVSPAVFNPFVYKFDNNPPTNPTLISVTPSGYTATNNFTFQWPNGYDGESGIAGYCYHSGANTGAFAVETCQTGNELDDVSAAYQQGTNVFYVRTYDNAGNYSPSYTTVSYYYSTQPPGPVTNLRAVPPTSPQNLFAFTWDLPSTYSGDPDLLTYCFSVNSLPTALNTTCGTDRFLAPFKAATQQGTNVLYMVAKDQANNVDWTSFAYTNFVANTVSPGIPLNLVVSDTSDRTTNRWSLTQTWDPPVEKGNGVANYIIERSSDDHTWAEVGSTSSLAYVDLNVQPNLLYYYRVRAADGVDNRGGPSAEVQGTPKGAFAEAPSIVVLPTAAADSNQASITWATARAATSFVYYGATPADLSQSKGSLDLATAHGLMITGLQPDTTYFYRVQSFDNERSYSLDTAYSQIYSFKTTDAAHIYQVKSDSVTMDSALISWSTTVPTTGTVEYGPGLSYGFEVQDPSASTTSHNIKLTGLKSGTNYHFRIDGLTDLQSDITSDDYTFSTIARPIITGVQFQGVDDEITAGVEVVWHTNVPTSSTVKYSALGQQLEQSQSDLTTAHSITIHGLASASDYSFTVEGRDQYGNLATSSPQNWKSSVDTRPPTISNVSISVSTVQGANGPKAQMIVIWNTDEPSTSQVKYGLMSSNKLGQSTPMDTEPTTNHIAIISNLNLSDIYQVQLESTDLSGNVADGAKTLVVTPDKEQSLLDGMLNLLTKVFRF